MAAAPAQAPGRAPYCVALGNLGSAQLDLARSREQRVRAGPMDDFGERRHEADRGHGHCRALKQGHKKPNRRPPGSACDAGRGRRERGQSFGKDTLGVPAVESPGAPTVIGFSN